MRRCPVVCARYLTAVFKKEQEMQNFGSFFYRKVGRTSKMDEIVKDG